MGKGGYSGGSTLVGFRSGWFTTSVPKKKAVDPATACGNAAARARGEERERWQWGEDKTRLLSPDELITQIGSRPKKIRSLTNSAGPMGESSSVPSRKKVLREKRQAAIRKRLGMPELS